MIPPPKSAESPIMGDSGRYHHIARWGGGEARMAVPGGEKEISHSGAASLNSKKGNLFLPD